MSVCRIRISVTVFCYVDTSLTVPSSFSQQNVYKRLEMTEAKKSLEMYLEYGLPLLHRPNSIRTSSHSPILVNPQVLSIARLEGYFHVIHSECC
jgi:hypothetical protein